jgi:hypothetical protein
LQTLHRTLIKLFNETIDSLAIILDQLEDLELLGVMTDYRIEAEHTHDLLAVSYSTREQKSFLNAHTCTHTIHTHTHTHMLHT